MVIVRNAARERLIVEAERVFIFMTAHCPLETRHELNCLRGGNAFSRRGFVSQAG
jgi:hypothetical protein